MAWRGKVSSVFNQPRLDLVGKPNRVFFRQPHRLARRSFTIVFVREAVLSSKEFATWSMSELGRAFNRDGSLTPLVLTKPRPSFQWVDPFLITVTALARKIVSQSEEMGIFCVTDGLLVQNVATSPSLVYTVCLTHRID